jgi:hypothetical protein
VAVARSAGRPAARFASGGFERIRRQVERRLAGCSRPILLYCFARSEMTATELGRQHKASELMLIEKCFT